MKTRWAYAPYIIVFACSVTLIITQALGAPASLAERITWLAIAAAMSVAAAYQMASARTWKRLYRSTSELYDKCEANQKTWERLYKQADASADYWMAAAESNGRLAGGGEPDP